MVIRTSTGRKYGAFVGAVMLAFLVKRTQQIRKILTVSSA